MLLEIRNALQCVCALQAGSVMKSLDWLQRACKSLTSVLPELLTSSLEHLPSN